jgi:hypothetical protein
MAWRKTAFHSNSELVLKTFRIKQLKGYVHCSYFNSVTGRRNYLLLIRYPFFLVTTLLQLLVTDILSETKSLLVTTKATSYVWKPLLRYIYR